MNNEFKTTISYFQHITSEFSNAFCIFCWEKQFSELLSRVQWPLAGVVPNTEYSWCTDHSSSATYFLVIYSDICRSATTHEKEYIYMKVISLMLYEYGM